MGGLKKASVSPVFMLLSLQTFLLLAFVSIFAYFIIQGVRQTSATLEQQAQAAAHVVATNAAWMSEVARQTLRRMDAALGQELSTTTPEFDHMLQGIPPFADAYVVDHNGSTLFATIPGAEQVSITDRAYFSEIREGQSFYVSSAIVSRLTNEPIFVFSKRLERNGHFSGAAVVSFPAAILEPILHSLDLPEHSTISLVRNDGMVIARVPPAGGAIDLSQHPLMTEHLPAGPTGTYASAGSPVDGAERVVSYRSLPEFNMIALASVATAERWAQFRWAILATILITSPILLALVLGTAWAVRLLSRQAKQNTELEVTLEANKLLMREIHHRVKNNLQSVRSLVALHDLPVATKKDFDARLRAMAAMHEHLYRFDRFVDIDAHDYVPVVVGEALSAYGTECEVNFDVDSVLVDRDHAMPLALLASEVVANACKYAFADGRAGKLDISLKASEGGRAKFTVADNGVGLAPNRREGMGTRLIRGLIGQMGGSYSLSSDARGTVFEAEVAVEIQGHHRPKADTAA
ncbi:sensor histidine kinase [Pelagibacterium limicola]|uniref:sensor histidine kinase n=1 Tax=Pelagibacterium limicola TaxID=2791022 RepID=UPI0018AF971C|nr:cache domain-containing protein [Pelagibacterium limicola]